MKHLWEFKFHLFLPLAVVLSVFTTSCDWFKPARDSKDDKVYSDDDISDLQGTKIFDPETGEWRTVREIEGKTETIKWTEISEEKMPPITSDGEWSNNSNGNNGAGSNPNTSGGQYNVSMVLPFLANQYDTSVINDNAFWAVHFYGGAKLAYENLSKEGVNLKVQITDSEASTAKVNRLANDNRFKSADLVIGPYKRDNVKILADAAKKDQRPLAVPYTALLDMGADNPNYIQLNPSLESHCRAITRHARAKYNADEIVLIARDQSSEKNRLVYFQNENKVIERNDIGFTEFLVKDQTLDYSDTDISPYIKEGKTTVFIIPSWNETFVYSLLHQMMMKQDIGEEIVVYGMPQWAEFDQIDPEFYQNLSVHISSAFYIDPNDERVRQFKQKFFDEYGAIPQDEAFLGFDAMLYFGKMLDKWGRDFPKSLDREPFDVLHGRFEFERVVLNPEEHKEDLDYYDLLENQFVHILEFRDFRFQPNK